MAMSSSIRGERQRRRSGLSEAVVLISMGTVSAVLAAVLVLQLGTPVWAAAAIAAMFLGAVLAAHVLVRRSEQLAVLARELATLDERLGRVAGGLGGPGLGGPGFGGGGLGGAGPGLGGSGSGGSGPGPRPETRFDVAPGRPAQQPTLGAGAPNGIAPVAPTARTGADAANRRAAPSAEPTLGDETLRSFRPAQPAPSGAVKPQTAAPELSIPALSVPSAATSVTSTTPMQGGPTPTLSSPKAELAASPDRPRAAAPLAAPVLTAGPTLYEVPVDTPAVRAAESKSVVAADAQVEPASKAPASVAEGRSPEFDQSTLDALLVETRPRPPIDDLLKRLAGDISNGVGLRDVRAESDVDIGFDTPILAPWPGADNGNAEPGRAGAVVTHETASHADAMEVDALDAESAEFAAAQGKVAAVIDALSNDRIDLFLEPIIGFETLAPEHFDVTLRLRLADGEALDGAQYAEAARGTGLLALIDTVKIAQAKRFVIESMPDGSERVLNSLDAETLTSEQFQQDIADLVAHSSALAGRLVLTFRQSEVRAFAPIEWQALARLSALGFRFGIDAITDLDMDFAELTAGGFVFARLDAGVLLDGMLVTSGDRVSPADVCRHLTESGLGLVVRRIDDPKLLARVMGFGVMMGQGAMFGGPRRAESMARRPRHNA